MASPVEVCNLALGRIGIDQLIEDLNDPNTRARQCNFHYRLAFDQVVQDFPWNFAQKVVQLAQVVGVTVPGYAYVYRYPSDCLKAHVLTDSSGNRMISAANQFYDIWNYGSQALVNMRWPYIVMADPLTPGARIIATDLPEAYLWHTATVEDINQTSPLFRSALAWKIAGEVALSIRAETRLHTNAVQQYAWVVSQAQVTSHGESVPDREPAPQAVESRW